MQSLWLIFQLLFCLLLGFVLAKRIPQPIEKICFQILPYFTYLLLIVIAMEFAQTLHQIPHPVQILSNAILIALATSIGSFVCCYAVFRMISIQPMQGNISSALFLKSLLNISYAFIALLVGYSAAIGLNHLNIDLHIGTWELLLVFMLLIGLDLAYSPLDRTWLNWKILLVPLACIVGSLLGAVLCMLILTNIKPLDLIMLSQGYGFYSMTGIVVTELRNAHLGSIALMNDLFREIFAILLMYIVGWRYPRSAISSAGATAMDVTLPMVKQACGSDFIPHAMVSGFVLSVLAPIVVSILAAL